MKKSLTVESRLSFLDTRIIKSVWWKATTLTTLKIPQENVNYFHLRWKKGTAFLAHRNNLKLHGRGIYSNECYFCIRLNFRDLLPLSWSYC